jgi:hypothetical protein
MLRSADRLSRLVVTVALVSFALALIAWLAFRPGAGRLDAAELCVGVGQQSDGVCVPLP